jgi:hypothetical protein
MPDRPKSQPKSFRELIEDLPAPIAIVDPAKWEDYAVFRETFVGTWFDDEKAAAARAFGQALFLMGLASGGGTWQGTTSDARAKELASVVADLRYLEGYLNCIGETGLESVQTSREARWSRFTQRLAKKVARLADEIEKEVETGYQQEDE